MKFLHIFFESNVLKLLVFNYNHIILNTVILILMCNVLNRTYAALMFYSTFLLMKIKYIIKQCTASLQHLSASLCAQDDKTEQ